MFYAMGISDGDDSWRAHACQWFVARIDGPAYGIFVVEEAGHVVACAMGASAPTFGCGTHVADQYVPP